MKYMLTVLGILSIFLTARATELGTTKPVVSDIAREHLNKEVNQIHLDLTSKGISNEIITLESNALAVKILPSGNSKLNKISRGLQKSLKVNLLISPEMTLGAGGLFSFEEHSIYLDGSHAMHEDFDILMHEIRHANFKKNFALRKNDIFDGLLNRNTPLTGSSLSSYVTEGMSLEENFTFAYQLKLMEKSALIKKRKTEYQIEIGREINTFTVDALTELEAELRQGIAKVDFGIVDSSMNSLQSGTKMLAYILIGSQYNLTGFLNTENLKSLKKNDYKEFLQISLKQKIEFYKGLSEAWKNVELALISENAENLSRTIKLLSSGTRAGFQVSAPNLCRKIFK